MQYHCQAAEDKIQALLAMHIVLQITQNFSLYTKSLSCFIVPFSCFFVCRVCPSRKKILLQEWAYYEKENTFSIMSDVTWGGKRACKIHIGLNFRLYLHRNNCNIKSRNILSSLKVLADSRNDGASKYFNSWFAKHVLNVTPASHINRHVFKSPFVQKALIKSG